MAVDELKREKSALLKGRERDAAAACNARISKLAPASVEAKGAGRTCGDADFAAAGRAQSVASRERRLAVVNKYTPQMLSEEKIREIPPTLPDKSAPAVRKHFKTGYAGKCDRRLVSDALKRFRAFPQDPLFEKTSGFLAVTTHKPARATQKGRTRLPVRGRRSPTARRCLERPQCAATIFLPAYSPISLNGLRARSSSSGQGILLPLVKENRNFAAVRHDDPRPCRCADGACLREGMISKGRGALCESLSRIFPLFSTARDLRRREEELTGRGKRAGHNYVSVIPAFLPFRNFPSLSRPVPIGPYIYFRGKPGANG